MMLFVLKMYDRFNAYIDRTRTKLV